MNATEEHHNAGDCSVMNPSGSKVFTTQTDRPYAQARPCHIHNAGLLYIYQNKTVQLVLPLRAI